MAVREGGSSARGTHIKTPINTMKTGSNLLTDIVIRRAITSMRKDVKQGLGVPKKRLSDGACLYLVLSLSTATEGGVNSRWVFMKQKSKSFPRLLEIGLGSYPAVKIAQAREKRKAIEEMIAAGLDPQEEKRKERQRRQEEEQERRRRVQTFSMVAERYIAKNETSWALTDPRRAQKNRGLVKNHMEPIFDRVPVNEISWREAVALVQFIKDKGLSRSQLEKCAGLCKDVLRFAMSEGLRDESKAFPFDQTGPYAVEAKPLLDALKRERHFAALRPEDAPAFFADLVARKPTVSGNALIFVMLTALRSNAATGAAWSNVHLDEERPYLVVPDGAGRGTRKTKKQGAYRCLLSSYAIDFLRSLPVLAGSPYLHSSNGIRPVSREIVRLLIIQMTKEREARGLPGWRDYEQELDKDGLHPCASVHGMRSTFRTWVGENRNSFDVVAAEMILDHDTAKSKMDAYKTYDRSKLEAERLKILEAWGRYLVTGRNPDEPDGEPCEGWNRLLASAARE